MTLSDRIGWQDLRSTSAQRGRVLVVEDEPELRRVMQKLITGFGYTVHAAA